MYFNDEKKSTNIDKEFESNKKFNFDINILKNKYVLIGIGCFLVLIFMVVLFSKKEVVVKTEYFLELEGLTDMTIYQDSVFIDPGYKAYDNRGEDYTLDVVVMGLVDTSVVGEYVIEYQFNDIVKRRVVTVLGDVTHVTYLNLLGTSIVYLNIGTQYIEPGYVVLDSVEEDLDKKVVIDGNVNSNVAGTYKLIYSVINSSGVTISKERTVIVVDSDLNLTYSPVEYTSSDVVITVDVKANYFDYLLLPDGTKSTERMTSFNVSENGEYLFTIYNVDGSSKSSFLTISNIDKTAPSGNCTAVYNGKSTVINVYANDLSGINGYDYIVNGNSVEYVSRSTYTYNGNGRNVVVNIKDNTGNVKKVNCKYSETLSTTLYSMQVASKPSSTFPCGLNVNNHNKKLAEKVKFYGYKTRAGVVAAARYLTSDLGYLVEYWWAGKYNEVGLNSEWGCPKKTWDESKTTGSWAYGSVMPFGLDCSGFVKWAFINGGFDASLIPRSSQQMSEWADVAPDKVYFSSGSSKINQLKPGDLLWTPGHIALVVGVSDTQIKIAEAVSSGVSETLVDKYTGKGITKKSDFEAYVLLDNFYQKYGK